MKIQRRVDGYSDRMAIITDEEGRRYLLSYWTIIAWEDGNGLHRTWDGYSRTSIQNHLKRFGFNLTKKEWESMEVEGLPGGLGYLDIVPWEMKGRALPISPAFAWGW